MAPRTSVEDLGSNWEVVGNNAKDEKLYFKDVAEVVIGDDKRGYSDPVKVEGYLKQEDNDEKFKLYYQYCPDDKC